MLKQKLINILDFKTRAQPPKRLSVTFTGFELPEEFISTEGFAYKLIIKDIELNLEPAEESFNLENLTVSFDQKENLISKMVESSEDVIEDIHIELSRLHVEDEEKKSKKIPPIRFLGTLHLVRFDQDLRSKEFEVELTEEMDHKSKVTPQTLKVFLVVLTDETLFRSNNWINEEAGEKRKVESGCRGEPILREFASKVQTFSKWIYSEYQKTSISVSNSKDDQRKTMHTDAQKVMYIKKQQNAFVKDFISNSKGKTLEKLLHPIIEKLFFLQMEQVDSFNLTHEVIQAKLNEVFLMSAKISRYISTLFVTEKAKEARVSTRMSEFQSFNARDFQQRIKDSERLGLFRESEKLIIERIIEGKPEVTWSHFVAFHLRQQKFEFAEVALRKIIESGAATKMQRSILACLLLQRNRVKQAKALIDENIAQDKWSIIDNLIMSFILEWRLNKVKLAKKHFNVSKKKIEINRKISDLGSEDVWKELMIFFMRNSLSKMAYELLNVFKENKNFSMLMKANLLILKNDFSGSNELLKQLFEIAPTPDLLAIQAHNSFFLSHLYQTEDLLLSTLPAMQPENILLLALSLLQRKSYADSALLFGAIIKSQPMNYLGWKGLAQSEFGCGNFDRSEEALMNASKSDSDCGEIAALMLQFMIGKNDNEINANMVSQMLEIIEANECFNLRLLKDLAEACEKKGFSTEAQKLAEIIRELDAINPYKFVFEQENHYILHKLNRTYPTT